MLTPGANFAEAVGVRLNLPTQGVRSVSITWRPYCLGVGASVKGECHMRQLRRSCADTRGCDVECHSVCS
jgi:hypothetical protein